MSNSFTFTFTSTVLKNKVSGSGFPRNMQTMKQRFSNLLCYTCLAPLIRAKRAKEQQALANEYHDRQRIDRLLNDLVHTYADLLA